MCHVIIYYGSIHHRTMSGVTCYHLPGNAHTIGQRRAWHDHMDLGQHTQLDDVGRETPSLTLERIPSRTMSGLACHNRPLTTYMVGLRRAWHVIIFLGMNIQSEDIGCGMTSSQLYDIHRVRQCRALHSIITLGQHA